MSNDLTEMLLGMHKDDEEIAPTRENYVRSLIPYPGNKFDSLKHLLAVLPIGKTFVDGCGGSGVVTLNLRHHYPLRVFNDRHNGVTSFYRCIREQDKLERLINRLELTIHSREEFIWCRDTWESVQNDDVERAARWYYSVQHSFAGIGRNFARATQGKAQHDQALHNKLPLFRSISVRFRNVQVENLDICQCIRDYDSEHTVFYIDPDYIDVGVGLYSHKVDHRNLLDLIFSSKGYFAVSGYANKLYDSCTGWTDRRTWKVQSSIRSKAYNENNNLADKANVMSEWETKEEVLWIKDFNE